MAPPPTRPKCQEPWARPRARPRAPRPMPRQLPRQHWLRLRLQHSQQRPGEQSWRHTFALQCDDKCTVRVNMGRGTALLTNQCLLMGSTRTDATLEASEKTTTAATRPAQSPSLRCPSATASQTAARGRVSRSRRLHRTLLEAYVELAGGPRSRRPRLQRRRRPGLQRSRPRPRPASRCRPEFGCAGMRWCERLSICLRSSINLIASLSSTVS
jgi:hypothetical protein